MTVAEYLDERPRGAAARLAERSGASSMTISRLREGGLIEGLALARAVVEATDGEVTLAEVWGPLARGELSVEELEAAS